eukprot:1737004-Pyramimonas_sp.AAC.1
MSKPSWILRAPWPRRFSKSSRILRAPRSPRISKPTGSLEGPRTTFQPKQHFQVCVCVCA